MPSLFEPATANNILQRINVLQAASTRQWGTMTISQMMAHCSQVFEMSLGDTKEARNLFTKIIGKLIKGIVLGQKPYKQGLPTGKNFIIKEDKDFAFEKQRLLTLLNRFLQAGEKEIVKNEHALFGKLTAEEWGFAMWKHTDHHLKQFGV